MPSLDEIRHYAEDQLARTPSQLRNLKTVPPARVGFHGFFEDFSVGDVFLHDVGKTVSGLGLPGRVVATVAGMAGKDDLSTRVYRYLQHAELGAQLLEEAGSDPLTVAWAREHHLPPDRWTVPAEVGTALKAADDD